MGHLRLKTKTYHRNVLRVYVFKVHCDWHYFLGFRIFCLLLIAFRKSSCTHIFENERFFRIELSSVTKLNALGANIGQ